MKKVLASLVLVGCYLAVIVLEELACRGAMWFLDELSALSIVAKIILIFFGGSALLGLVFTPVFYGSMLTVLASEAVSPSPNGTRYIVFSTIVLTLTVISFFSLLLIKRTLNIACIFVVLYCIALLIMAKDLREERISIES